MEWMVGPSHRLTKPNRIDPYAREEIAKNGVTIERIPYLNAELL
jgi:hypothetical protein